MNIFTNVERLTNSRNGNARFRLTTREGAVIETAADSSCAYDVENAYYDIQAGEVIAATERDARGKLTRFTVIAVQERLI